jgi:hypothetical protein
MAVGLCIAAGLEHYCKMGSVKSSSGIDCKGSKDRDLVIEQVSLPLTAIDTQASFVNVLTVRMGF